MIEVLLIYTHTNYDRGTLDLHTHKFRGDRVLPHNLVFLFQVENVLYGKNENIEFLWHYATDCLHFSHHVFGKIMAIK